MYSHDYGCRSSGEHSDAAKRLSDAYNLHYSVGNLYGTDHHIGKWLAVSLAEGKSDGVIYDSKYDAVTHQSQDEKYYAYIQIQPTSMSPCAAEAVLNWQRQLYDAQLKQADRSMKSGGYDIIPRLTIEDQAEQEMLIRQRSGKFAIGSRE